MEESDLYEPIKRYFSQRGFRVRGEVGECDLCAELDGSLVAVELKRRLELRLLEQAVERQRSADLVYVAVPSGAFATRRTRRAQQERLIRRLELGCLVVSSGGVVEPFFHPEPYRPRRRRTKRSRLLREISSRSVDGNVGGTSARPRLTAYREQALEVAWTLSERGPASPREVRKSGAPPKAPSILQKNYYGWFVRVDRGVYGLTEAGERALADYPELTARFSRKAEG